MPTSIQDVFLQFEPMEALEADDPRYVDCFTERGVPTLYANMSLPLAASHPTVQFFSGYLGDGKTTLLRQLRSRFEADGSFVAYGEADQWLELADLAHEDLLLALLATVDDALRQRYRDDCEAGFFQQVFERLARVAQLPVDLKTTVKLGLASLTATVRDVPDVRLQLRQELRQARGPSFLDVVNEYLDRARELIERRGHQRLVVMLDNLDRVPEVLGRDYAYADERLFVSHAGQLTQLRCHVIYVVRLALAHAQAANLQERYGRTPRVIPMVPVRRPDGQPDERGLAKLREVIERRVGTLELAVADAFEEKAVHALCRASGGHLRELMSLVQRACAECLGTTGELPVRAVHADASIREFRALRRMKALEHRDALDEVARTHQLAGLEPEVRDALLKHRLVYEYWAKEVGFWYDVCPLCDEDAR